MSKIIIHIGTHKTATTSIQDTLFHNRDLLANNNIIIPKIGKSRGHHSLVTAWIDMKPYFHLAKGPDLAWDELVENYANKDKTVFLSSEEFSRMKPVCVDMRQLRERVRKFDEVEIVCVLRNQINFTQSVYMEISKNVNRHDVPKFITKTLEQKVVEGLWLDYNGLYDHIRKGFSADEIRLISFESAIKTEGGIVGQFLKILETDLKMTDLEPFEQSLSNVSPEPLALWAANIANAPRALSPKLLRAACCALERELGENTKTTLLSRNEAVKYSKTFEPLNRNLENKVLSVQPDFRMAPVSVGDGVIHRGDISGTFWMKFVREICSEFSKSSQAQK